MERNLKYGLTPPRDNDDQRIMHSFWTRGTDGHNQTKSGSLRSYFF